jgi:hypothetical protein
LGIEIFRVLHHVMMKQHTMRALQQSQIKWNDKNTSAAISYIYSRDFFFARFQCRLRDAVCEIVKMVVCWLLCIPPFYNSLNLYVF